MSLEQAIDYLSKNCPQVFGPIAEEMNRLGEVNTSLTDKSTRMEEDLATTQKALNELIFNTMNGGL